MDWKDVGIKIAKNAPLLGGLLNYVPGGAPVASAISMVSSFLGTKEEPDAVMEALEKDPDKIFELKKLEETNRPELAKIAMQREANILAADTQRILEVNNTMRGEAKSDKWWVSGWRPFWGYVAAIAFLEVVTLICFLAYKAIILKDTSAITMIPQMITSLSLLFAIPGAILGVSAHHRGKKQRVEAGEKVLDVSDSIKNFLKK